MQRVTASQVSFSNVIGEPGHTNHSRGTTPRRELQWFVLGALLSKPIEGLPTPRIKGNLTFQS
jgi:hypothetical protein